MFFIILLCCPLLDFQYFITEHETIKIHTGKLDIFQGSPLIWGGPLIDAVTNFPREPSYLGGPFIRNSRVNLHVNTKTTILGQLLVVHISWLFFYFSDKKLAILDLATRYLTYRFFVVLMLILELINLHLDTKTTIPGELVHASWLFL